MALHNKINGDHYWTTVQAATYLNFHRTTLLRLLIPKNASKTGGKKIRNGPITPPPYRRFGDNIRFPIEEFKKWADGPFYKSEKS